MFVYTRNTADDGLRELLAKLGYASGNCAQSVGKPPAANCCHTVRLLSAPNLYSPPAPWSHAAFLLFPPSKMDERVESESFAAALTSCGFKLAAFDFISTGLLVPAATLNSCRPIPAVVLLPLNQSALLNSNMLVGSKPLRLFLSLCRSCPYCTAQLYHRAVYQ